MKNNVLFHYTCKEHLPKILKAGYLKLTDSCIIPPDGTLETELRCRAYKPVVWLTDSDCPDHLGLAGSCFDKTEIKITVARRSSMKYWKCWKPQKEMPKWWKDAFCKGMNCTSWYVSEEIIPLSSILKIENRYDGTVYYEAEKAA